MYTGQPRPLAGMPGGAPGTLSGYTRQSVKEAIEAHGGSATGSVSKRTSLVLAGDKAGSKAAKARELGIPVIDEEQFAALLDTGELP